jgi:hypothetical protein
MRQHRLLAKPRTQLGESRQFAIDEESSARAKLRSARIQPGKGKQHGEEKAEEGEKGQEEKSQEEKGQA